MKKITLVFLFLIGAVTVSFGQFSENFDAGITAPAGWSVINGGGPNTFIFVAGAPGSAFSAPNAAQINYDIPANTHDDYLVTPQITVTAGVNDRLTYYVKNQDADFLEEYIVKLSTTTATAAAFTVVLTPQAEAPVAWTQFTIDLTAYIGQSIYIGFHAVSTDEFRLLFDNVVNDTAPSLAPGCVTLTAPTNAATGVNATAAVVLTWSAPTTGGAVASYDVFLDTNTTPTTLLGNQAALTRNVTGLLGSTTYYWRVVAKNAAGDATGCSTFSFTTAANPFLPYCGPLAFVIAVEPITLVNFAGINNVTPPAVLGATAHEVFTSISGNVIAGSSNTITLKGNTDGNFINRFIVFADWNQDGDFGDLGEAYPITQTIANSTGVDAISATQAIIVPPTALVGTTRMRVKKIFAATNLADPCLGAGFGQAEDYSLIVAAVPADLPDYVSLQFPATASFAQGGNVIVYGQVFEAGLTNVDPNIVGQAPGINAWVGISPIGANTNPNTWTNWIPTTWNAGSVGNNDEYEATIGATLLPGTYYYATRFQLNGGAFVYGGINATNNGNFWDGTTFNSGVLTISAPVAPANDECTGAVALTAGGVFADNAVIGTSLFATQTDGLTNTCNVNITNNVWYSVVVPASGNITIETQANAGSAYTDSLIGVFSGTCSALVAVGCNDDAGIDNFSLLALTGQTPGATLFITVWRFSFNGGGLDGTFRISAYDGSLSNNSFDNANFSFYPNPVKNSLNLSYNQEISTIEVYNLLGQKVISTTINANTAQVDMSNVSKGAYMVRVTSNNQVKTIKVIKE